MSPICVDKAWKMSNLYNEILMQTWRDYVFVVVFFMCNSEDQSKKLLFLITDLVCVIV